MQRDQPDRAGDESLSFDVGRLDRLAMPLAERVLRRAIELDDTYDLGPGSLSRTALDQIAAELGVSGEAVDRAIAEELVATHTGPLGPLEKILAPRRLTGGQMVDAPPAVTTAAIERWMTRHEGMQPRVRTRAGTTYERDRNPLTALRMGFKVAKGTGALRNLGSVQVRQTKMADDRQLVEIDADTSLISRVAGGIGGGITALSAAGGVAVALQPGGPDILQFLGGFAPGLVVAAAVALITARAWFGGVRKGLQRALDGISSPGLWK